MCFLCQIRTTTCVLLFLFTSLGVCSGGFGNPVTDDVKRVKKLCWSGVCWVLLNIYPLEQSLRELARVFGAISSNKDNIMIFITMLQNLRFQFDHEELEATMQVFKCHYRAVKWPSGLYFDYIRDILNSATHQEGGFRCVPPSCPAPTTPGKKHAPTHSIHSAPTYSIHKSLPHRACCCRSQEVKHRTMNRLGQGGVCCPCFRSQCSKGSPDWLHHCLVWQLLGLRPQGTTESSAYGPVHHWGQAPCHPGPLYQAVSEEAPKICQRLQPP
uniref:Kit ligand n=1 Tax=Salmo trutta TaxID=8032 RepID=A0A674B018_SALTR